MESHLPYFNLLIKELIDLSLDTANARIAETFTLPSKGLIYEEQVDPEIILGSMKTKHEMMRLSASENNNKIMADIIDDCLVGNPGISSYDMCLGDFQYLMYKLRTVTFGPEYQMYSICPICGSENTISVNLDDLEVFEYEDNLAELLEVTLPVSEHEITLTLQTPRILDLINKRVNEAKRRRKANENTTLLYNIVTSITQVDGEVPNAFALEEMVKELPMRDTNFLLNRINEINSKIGVQLDIDATCSQCGKYFVAPFRIYPSFFRPDDF